MLSHKNFDGFPFLTCSVGMGKNCVNLTLGASSIVTHLTITCHEPTVFNICVRNGTITELIISHTLRKGQHIYPILLLGGHKTYTQRHGFCSYHMSWSPGTVSKIIVNYSHQWIRLTQLFTFSPNRFNPVLTVDHNNLNITNNMTIDKFRSNLAFDMLSPIIISINQHDYQIPSDIWAYITNIFFMII